MLTCRELARAFASDEPVLTSWRRRLEVRLHLFKCPACRRYVAQIRALGTAVRNLVSRQQADPETLDRMATAILKDTAGR